MEAGELSRFQRAKLGLSSQSEARSPDKVIRNSEFMKSRAVLLSRQTYKTNPLILVLFSLSAYYQFVSVE